VHVAGLLDDGTVESLDSERLERVFAPKADAAWHLHELTAGLDLSAFVLFSSAAGVLGSPGQANYAAANAFLDALAERRRGEGLPATSIAWGMWDEAGGMVAHLGAADLARLGRSGIAALSADQGLDLFDAAVAGERSTPLAVRFDAAALRAQASARTMPAILSAIVRAPAGSREGAGSLVAKLGAAGDAERETVVLEAVRGEVAAVLGHPSIETIEPEAPFQDLGFDSLAAVELRNRLGLASGLRLPATLVFDHPSAARVAAYLLAELGPGEEGPKAQLESQEEEIRRALASIPLSRLRRSGLLSSLVELARAEEGDEEGQAGSGEESSIDSMDVEELIRESLTGDDAVGRALAAGGRGPRRDRRVPPRPRLGPRAPLRPRSRQPRYELRARGRLRRGTGRLRCRFLRHRAARSAGDGPAAAAAA
jgi:polyketide synthase 12